MAAFETNKKSAAEDRTIGKGNNYPMVDAISMVVDPRIAPAAELTSDCPTSKMAITILKVLVTRNTAINALKNHLKNIQVSMSCILLRSVIMVISS